MTHIDFRTPAHALTISLALGCLLASTFPAQAQKGDDPPKPKIDCSKPEHRKKPACKNRNGELGDAELFYAGYWLARKGDYQAAVHYLAQARNPADERILTYLGYAYRKLGRADLAMIYYERALAANPGYVVARAYIGEAFLEQGAPAKAAEQLAVIERNCGTTCTEYKDLAAAIARHAAKG